jgi:two-component system OmpR family response regulator
MHDKQATTRFRVLVVDDYPDAADSACMLLSMLGHDCRSATSARDALVEAEQFEPDVAILDIGLPDLSGFDLAREFRKRFPDRAIYLAAVTGWGQPEDRIKALAAGFNHHVLKPADRNKLMAIMECADRQLRAVTSGGRGRA